MWTKCGWDLWLVRTYVLVYVVEQAVSLACRRCAGPYGPYRTYALWLASIPTVCTTSPYLSRANGREELYHVKRRGLYVVNYYKLVSYWPCGANGTAATPERERWNLRTQKSCFILPFPGFELWVLLTNDQCSRKEKKTIENRCLKKLHSSFS